MRKLEKRYPGSVGKMDGAEPKEPQKAEVEELMAEGSRPSPVTARGGHGNNGSRAQAEKQGVWEYFIRVQRTRLDQRVTRQQNTLEQ